MEKLKKKIIQAVDAYKSGNLSEAEQMVKKLIIANPKVVFLYNLLGLIFVDLKKINQALESYEKGIKIDPSFAMIYNNLGLLFYNYKYSGNVKKVEDLYKKSISLKQNIPEPHSNLGNLYNALNRPDEAIYSYKKAIDINPKFSIAFLNLASVYVSLGKFREAEKELKTAINLSPNLIHAHRLLSRIIKYSENHEHLAVLKKLHKETRINNIENKLLLAFSLGKACEDIKDFDQSFKYYNEANSLSRKNINFSIEEEKQKFKEIKNTFTKRLFNKYENSGYLESSPIFIVGMPRSGTTLIEQILSHHPEVFGADEIEFIPSLINKNFGDKNLLLFFDEVVKFHKTELKTIGEEYCAKMKNLSNNSERTTDKLPTNFLSVGFIKLILPNSKIIHCHRNSRDNCTSIFKNHFTSGKVKFAYDLDEITEYFNFYKDLMNYWNDLLPGFIFDIKYESLISETEAEIRNLLKFCDLEWFDDCLNFHNNKRQIKTASDIQVRSKIYKSSIGSWKNYEKHTKKSFLKLSS